MGKRILFIGLVFLSLLPVKGFVVCAQDAEQTQKDTLRYGTDNEIAELIKTIRNDKINYLDDDLLSLVKTSKNENVVKGILSLFIEREKKGAEDAALKILSNRDNENASIVISAVDYLGAVKENSAVDELNAIVANDDDRFMVYAVRSLGKIAGAENSGIKDDICASLLNYYENHSPSNDRKREIILSLGSTGSSKAAPLLKEIITNNDENTMFRTAALEAAAKIKDGDFLGTVIEASSSPDANIRAAAIKSLGTFDGEQSDNAILDAFRDSFFRTRLAAANAAGARKMTAAIPFLRYRAERDDAQSVREESVKALGLIDHDDSNDVLTAILNNKASTEKIRILSAEMLLKNNADKYCQSIIEKADEAKGKKQTTFYQGLLRALSTAKTNKLEVLTARFFASKDVIEKAFAIEFTANNSFSQFKEELEKISKEKNTLSSKAVDALSKL
ncbi:hypothetical protein AGMMS50212_15320 [Spirochaetia bacterium]|nr:hypothetical protein AGMMS50212_15320 [Spirochaetia bacterium]